MSTTTAQNKAIALYDFQTGDKNHMPMNSKKKKKKKKLKKTKIKKKLVMNL